MRKAIGELGLRGFHGNELSVSNYQYILRNHLYYGLIYFHGEFWEGKHEPIVSKKLYDQVQEIMEKKSKPQTTSLKPYVYRGLFKCGECGCYITAETQKGRNYLRCIKRKGPCSQKYVREEAITDMMRAESSKYSLSTAADDWLIAEVEKDKAGYEKAVADRVKAVNDEIAALDAKLNKLMDAYLGSALTLDEYQTAKNKLVSEKRLLKEKMASMEHAGTCRFEPIINFLNDCKQAAILAQSSDATKIRSFFQKVGPNPLVRDRALVFSPQMPFALVPSLPKNAKQNGGGATGGVWGGMPPRPPHCDLRSPFSGDFEFSAKLLAVSGMLSERI